MNTLEKMALENLINHLISAYDRCHESNAERMQHERIFIRGDIEKAIKIVKALDQNH